MQHIELDAAQAYRVLPSHAFCASLSVRSDDEHLRCLEEGFVLIAERQQAPIGFVLVRPIDGRAHILETAVALRAQGQGVGRAMIAEAERIARERGYTAATLTTFRDVAWNGPFYERLGYRTIEPDEHRPELRAVIAREAEEGFARAARIAMEKPV